MVLEVFGIECGDGEESELDVVGATDALQLKDRCDVGDLQRLGPRWTNLAVAVQETESLPNLDDVGEKLRLLVDRLGLDALFFPELLKPLAVTGSWLQGPLQEAD